MVALNDLQTGTNFSHSLTVTGSNAVNENEPVCRINSCGFCRVAKGGKDEFADRTGHGPELNVSGISTDLMVIMDSFPIGHAGGHILVVPRKHMASLAQFDDQNALRETLERTVAILTELFPDHWLFTFEHGPGELAGKQVKCGGCHVDHAHGHILVLPKTISFEDIQESVEDTLTELGWELATQTDFNDLPMVEIAPFTRNQPYLQIGMLGEKSMAVTYRQEAQSEPIPSQLLRKIVSTVAGKSAPIHWNWKIALQQNLTDRLDQYRLDGLDFQTAFNELAELVRTCPTL